MTTVRDRRLGRILALRGFRLSRSDAAPSPEDRYHDWQTKYSRIPAHERNGPSQELLRRLEAVKARSAWK